MTDNFSQISEHLRQISGLKRLIQNNNSDGVFAFIGPEFLNTKLVAQAFCATILNCDLAEIARHPDAIILTPDIKDSGKKSHDIDQVRNLIRQIGQRSMTGKMTVIIESADALNLASQNALLKSLEEPSIGTTIILLVANESSLLPTIYSRVTSIHFYGTLPTPAPEYQADAERFCHSSKLERLLVAQELAKREQVDFDLLFSAMIFQLEKSGKMKAKSLNAILTARDRLTANGNSTVVLTECAVQLS